MNRTAETSDSERPIVTLVSDPGNQKVLGEWLEAHDQYRQVEPSADILTTPFEAVLLDRQQLFNRRGDLIERNGAEPGILPYLLLVPESNHQEVRNRLEAEYPDLWSIIDGIIDMPLTENHLDERLETHLRLREQSLSVNEQREQLDVLNRVLRHDIRNDMHVLLAWANNLEGEVTPDGQESLDKILRAADHVVELTTVAQDIATFIHGKGDPDLEAVSLERSLTAELEKRRETLTEADISMSEPPATDTRVLANELLSSVFRNLINNAVQHNHSAQPAVTIAVTEGEDLVQIRVADNGPGIPDEMKNRLFGQGNKGMDSEGTGIGLYLVQQLVESYGGDVWIEDRPSDDGESVMESETGAVFVVELRKAPERAQK